jgi:hypothetical protein
MRSHARLVTALLLVAFACARVQPACAVSAPAAASGRVALRFDPSEAEAVLAIVEARRAGRIVTEDDWRRLFSSRPYVRLAQREAAMHRRFTDDDFRRFVVSAPLLARADSLRRALDAWARNDLAASAARVLAYLPDSARIRADVYPMIKPVTNSFVFEPSTDAAIFLYLDPAETAAQFDNTVAHELHHIGFSSISAIQEARFKDLATRARKAVDWMGAFGEGFAMLAAAGGPDVHPHASSPPAERARWDRDMTHFDRDLRTLSRFFLDVLDGRLATDDAIQARAFTFFGVQGPWYTVGYRMAVVVERRYGRAALIECMVDPRQLLARYNAATEASNRAGGQRRARWPARLLERIGAPR